MSRASAQYVIGYIFGGITLALCPSKLWLLWILLIPAIGALVSEWVDREFYGERRAEKGKVGQ